MSPGNQGIFQLLKEVAFRRILVFFTAKCEAIYHTLILETSPHFCWNDLEIEVKLRFYET